MSETVWQRLDRPVYERGMDRENWGDGPWVSEPDAMHWKDETSGLDCLIYRGPLGQLNGYVGVPRTHPYFVKSYDEIEMIEPLRAHGGLTFAGTLDVDLPFRLHSKRRGHSESYRERVQKKWGKRWSVAALNLWWFGFDCAHHMDYVPGLYATMKLIEHEMPLRPPRIMSMEIYRDLAYVRRCVTEVAAKLAPVEGYSVRHPLTIKQARTIEALRRLEHRAKVRELAAKYDRA